MNACLRKWCTQSHTIESGKRVGFTLIELLVVIAIFAVLIGLLLPAVQKVRAAAARVQCSNNLKQLAIAVQIYHDTNNAFPVSAGPGYNFNSTSPNCWSWLVRILPFVEQQNLFQQLGFPTNTIVGAGFWVALPVNTFQCPADGTTDVPRTNEQNITGIAVGQTNYKGVCGDNWAWGNWANTIQMSGNSGLDNGNGIFFRTDYKRPLTMVSITDGTSNTFMIGEDVPQYNIHCDWPFFNHATGTCAIPLNYGIPPQTDPKGARDWHNVYSFRSRHTNGANFAYADGSVQFISQSIDMQVYMATATYQGGEPVQHP